MQRQRSPRCANPDGYDVARRAEALGRLRRVTLCLLPPLTLALVADLHVFGESAPLRALALVGMLGLAALTHVLVAQRFAGGRAISIAAVFIVALGLLLLGVVADSPAGFHTHLGTMSALMMGAAIMVPWGPWPQLLVAALLALGYGRLSAGVSMDAAQAVDLVASLTDCVALSAIGAYVLDRQRRQAYREREAAERMTAQRELLLAASRELNATLDADATMEAITRLARQVVAADTVALVLLDERRNVLTTAFVSGDVLDVDREVLHLDVPTAALQPLLDALRDHGAITTPGPILQPFTDLAREQFGVWATLFVAIERNGRLLGYLTFNSRRPDVGFGAEEMHLARGFAAHCATALANAQLVTRLQHADRVKSDFVSTMSHELRTPLSVILGYTDVLADAVADAQARVVLDRIRVAGRDLLDLVQTTLDLNRLESGRDPAQCEPVAIQELWEELAGQYGGVERAGVSLRWEAVGAPIAYTDRRKLKIVVTNLVGNALKFTSKGEVQVCVRLAGERCVVVVRDTGIGIPAEHLTGIFDMFRQVDPSDRRAHGGVGLGLYIVRKLAEQLGATLEVRSTVGVGSTFTLSLPATATAAATTAAAA